MSRGKSSPEQIKQAALELFSRHGVHKTSLQMIAGELGVTKAAVYYHFRTKQEIVEDTLEPAMEGLARLVEQAQNIVDERGRIEAIVRGLADEAIIHRDLYSVILRDVAATSVVSPAREVLEELNRMLVGKENDSTRQVEVAMFLAGLVAPAVNERVRRMTDDQVRQGIITVGMALLKEEPRAYGPVGETAPEGSGTPSSFFTTPY